MNLIRKCSFPRMEVQDYFEWSCLAIDTCSVSYQSNAFQVFLVWYSFVQFFYIRVEVAHLNRVLCGDYIESLQMRFELIGCCVLICAFNGLHLLGIACMKLVSFLVFSHLSQP
jgi:hypothetical protein